MSNNNGLIVNVTITKSTRTVSQAAFNIPCIFGNSGRVEVPTAYTSSSDMLTINGGPFMDSDPEYIEAESLMGQAIKPPQFLVAPNTPSVAQIDTFQVGTLTVGHVYKFTMGTFVISYTSIEADTQQSILAALLTAIGTAYPENPPVTGAVTSTGASATLTLTAVTAGIGVTYTNIDASLTHVVVAVNHSIATDIATAQAAAPLASPFYGVIVCSHAANDIIQVATYIETQLLVYVTATLDSGVLSNDDGNVMAVLKGLSLDRTMIMYSAQANTQGPDGAWMGYMLPTTPGVGNWAMKTLAEITPDDQLTPTQMSNIKGNNGNIYVTVGGNGCTLYGITPAGEYLDVTIFLDWLSSTIQSGIIAVETDPANLKIPYTNNGITQLETPVRSALQTGQNNQGLVPGWDVFAPNANDVPVSDRDARVLNGLGFDADLAGAINQINIAGFIGS